MEKRVMSNPECDPGNGFKRRLGWSSRWREGRGAGHR